MNKRPAIQSEKWLWKKTEKIPTHYYPIKQHVLHFSATEISLGKTVIYFVKMHCTHCNNWSWLFPMMLAYSLDWCYDRNTPWETSQSQGIVQGISNFPSLEAGKCKTLPPGKPKAEKKSTSETKLKVLQGPSPNQHCAALVNLIVLCLSLLAGAIFFPNLKIQQVN